MMKKKNKPKLKRAERKKLKISACYIVKNCADDMKISLASLKHAVDEIIVVDTGSTDSTVEVAKSFGAKVFYREWDDDFSAPRNLAIEHATGDWIVFLDSDEYFTEATKNNIRFIIEQTEKFNRNEKSPNAEGLLLYRVNLDNSKELKFLPPDFSSRIFKNQPGLHYIYKIHEQPQIGDRDLSLFPVPKEKLTLNHTGYSGALNKKKCERNLKLLLEELETTDNPQRLYYYLAQVYLGIGDKKNAEKFARLDIGTGKKSTTLATLSYDIMIDLLNQDSNRSEELLKFIKFAIDEFPSRPDFYVMLGRYYAERNREQKAFEAFEKAVEKFKTYNECEEMLPSTITEEIKIMVENYVKAKKAEKKNKAGGGIKISACYIVKNNADELKTSIESLKHAVDEIIVVDTGSTDSTVEVAKSFGAKVFFREWDDDFSAPRNLAIENATGDWIVFLDSDEYFSDETKNNLRSAIERVNKFNKNGILIYRVEIDKNRGNQILATNYVMRILKNKLGLHYVGKIHEDPYIGKNLLEDITFAPPNILTLYHTGYSAFINREKAERNLKLLLEELAETNNPQRIYGYIAECYNGLEDFANAEKFARLDIESADKAQPPMSSSCRIILSILAVDFKRLEERKKFAELAVKIFPAMPEFTAELAECFAMFGDLENAIKTMQAALKKFKNYAELEPTQFDENMAQFAENRIKLWIEKLNRR